MDPAKAIEIEMLAQLIEELDYYQVLKVDPKATRNQVKDAYRREGAGWHPDGFARIDDPRIRAAVHGISKRITEAYTVLRDTTLRDRYDRGLAIDRKRFLRYSAELDKEQKKVEAEEIGKNPKAREYYRLGTIAMQQGRFVDAEKQLKMALTWEPGNATYTAALKEAQKNIKTDFRIK
jgi:DnaJ-class molecular chaperone